MVCPSCGASDYGNGKFCIRCGQPLPQVAQASSPALPSSSAPTPLAPSAPGAYGHAPMAQTPQAGTPVSPIGPVTTAPASIWGPFAGYGSRGRHVAWLLDDLGGRAEELRQAVTDRFQQRAIPDAQVIPRILTAKGMLVEQRPYYLVQRSRATTGLYLARFGEDLYISQVSYLKSPVSIARVILMIAMAVFAVAYPTWLSDAVGGLSTSLFGGVSGLGDFAGVLCCLGPIYLASLLVLTLGLIVSLYRFLTEKDILAPLRVTPNEFDQDDLISLEKAVEQTVREAMDVIGIDSKLMPPAARYGLRERII